MDISLRHRDVARALFGLIAVLFVVAVAVEVARVELHWTSGFTDLWVLSGEQTIPTWWSSFLLAACGACLLVVASQRRASADRHAASWRLLGLIFLYMSVDELASIHELLNGIKPLEGVVYFPWVFPAIIVVLLVGARFLPFVVALPARRRRQFIVAGVVYVGAALGMELPLGWWASGHGEASLGYRLIDTVEEALEMVGLTLFLLALLEEVAGIRPRLVVALDGDGKA
jgi:hypothetical protein